MDQINNITFEKLKELCSVDIPEDEKQFLCYGNSFPHTNIIKIMKKIYGTMTNESRTNIKNVKNAICRADKLLVLKIIDVFTGIEYDEILEDFDEIPEGHEELDELDDLLLELYIPSTILYKKNKIAISHNFDTNLENIGSGIRYVNSLERCFSFLSDVDKYTGIKRSWYIDGLLYSEYNCIDGKKNGLMKYWYPNGQLGCEYTEIEGKKEGVYKQWFMNKNQLRLVCNYKNGVKNGLELKYYENNGNIKFECLYNNGIKPGAKNTYYNNGQLKSAISYFDNGLLHTKLYFDNGQLKYDYTYNKNGEKEDWETNYKDGKRTYYKNGKAIFEEYYRNGEFTSNETNNSKKKHYIKICDKNNKKTRIENETEINI